MYLNIAFTSELICEYCYVYLKPYNKSQNSLKIFANFDENI